MDAWCEQAGRDPATLRRSLLLFDALDPWGSPDLLSQLVERFSAIGMNDFVVFWPDTDEQAHGVRPRGHRRAPSPAELNCPTFAELWFLG